MPFQMIQGRFFVRGTAPDGDSIKFKANDPERWSAVPGMRTGRESRGPVQLRVEAVDALETHYSRPSAYQTEQPEPATNRLLDLLGITGVRWDRGGHRVTSASDGTEGYILTRGTGPYGRPIAFLFSGRPPSRRHEQRLEVDLLTQSANYKLLAEGFVYPLFYNTLFYDLRDALATAASAARVAGDGIWADDRTLGGVTIRSEADITGQNPILPKIFRRTVKHFRAGNRSLRGLDRSLAREEITILPQVQITGFDEVVNITGNRLRMTTPPEQIIVGSVIRR